MYTHFGQILWRTPLYPYSILFSDSEQKSWCSIVEKIKRDPIFLESIYWSSKDLYHRLLRDNSGDICNSKDREGLNMALSKYFIRSATRCTPYGIHAGCSLQRIALSEKENSCNELIMQRKVRVDISFLRSLVERLRQDESISPYLTYCRNDTVYEVGSYYRYTEANGQLAELMKNHVLDAIFNYRSNTEFTIGQMHEWIGYETDEQERENLILDLLDSGFVHLTITKTYSLGISFLYDILEKLLVVVGNSCVSYINLIHNINALVKKLNNTTLGDLPIEELEGLDKKIAALNISRGYMQVFHVDLFQSIPSIPALNNNHVQRISGAIQALGRLSSASSPIESELVYFRKKFLEHYELKEIPLTEVLDLAYGIGFPCGESIGQTMYNEWTEDLSTHKLVTRPPSNAWDNPVQNWFNKMFLQLEGNDSTKELLLNDEDISSFHDHSSGLPNQFSVLGSILPSGEIFLKSVGGAQAISLIGRFAFINSSFQSFSQGVIDDDLAHKEEVLYAEIVYIPEGRVANVARPSGLYPYEIVIIGSGLLPVERQIPINDLNVCVRNNEIILRSKKWNKRVIPRITNAYNHTLSHIVMYRFLAAIQHQGRLGLDIDFPNLALGRRFTPRISYKQIILHSATWQWTNKDVQVIQDSINPIKSLRTYLSNWKVPDLMLLEHGDNELLIDIRQDACLRILWQEMQRMKNGRFIEWLHGEATAKDGTHYINQFVLPLKKKSAIQIGKTDNYCVKNTIQRTFLPGSEWLYFKIYCSAYHSDRILQKINNRLRMLISDGQVIKFFFIRYSDPNYHLRLRLHLPVQDLHSAFSIVSNALRQEFELLKEECELWKIQIDSYEREVERYGESGVENAEDVFYVDSKLILNLLDRDDFSKDQQLRLFLAIKCVDKWLDLYGMDINQRVAFCGNMTDAFAQEFDSKIRSQLDHKYRIASKTIAQHMTSTDTNDLFAEWYDVLYSIPLQESNLVSYIHMSMNRLFSNEQRIMEYIVYLFSWKYYRTKKHFH